MSLELVDRARSSRKSPAALKIKVSNLRSRHPNEPILIVEGFDDVSVYETWCKSEILKEIYIISGSGKEQLLNFRKSLEKDTNHLADKLFFFIDSDYDGLQGHKEGNNIFCLERYAIENYLATSIVLKSIIMDELRVDASSETFYFILELFEKAIESLKSSINEINFHIFCCRQLGISLTKSIPQLSDFAKIDIEKVTLTDSLDNILNNKFPTERVITEEEKNTLIEDFNLLDPLHNHRGKFIYEFFKKWLNCFVENISSYPEIKGKLAVSTINYRSCAARSERPLGFKSYIDSIYIN